MRETITTCAHCGLDAVIKNDERAFRYNKATRRLEAIQIVKCPTCGLVEQLANPQALHLHVPPSAADSG
jgi:endogenous inhibitor of DNA gyrase (YacG/DUF329 family)